VKESSTAWKELNFYRNVLLNFFMFGQKLRLPFEIELKRKASASTQQ
jgi:hypothetical protein